MNGRSLFALLAFSLSFSSLVIACGDDPAPQKSSTLQLNGVYRPTQQGAIGSITFSNNKDYLLIPSGCTGGSCADIGTYRVDAATSSVILENGVTHQTQTIKLEEVKTSDATVALIKTFIGTRDLVDPGEQLVRNQQPTTNGQQQLNKDGQQQLNKDGSQQLAEQAQQLIQTIVEALMNKQGMKQDDQNKNDQNQQQNNQQQQQQPKPQDPKDCKTGVPTQDTPKEEADAYWARCPNGP